MKLLSDIANMLKKEKFFNQSVNKNTPAIVYHFKIADMIISQIYGVINKYNNISLYYALKANRNSKFLNFLNDKVDGVDVASMEELKIARRFFNKNFISVNGPGFNQEDRKTLLSLGMQYDYDNISQIIQDEKKNSQISLRINIKLDGDIDSRFGLDLTNDTNIEILKNYNLSIYRIHIHNGEKNLDFIDSFDDMLYNLTKLTLLKDLREINIGGGFTRLFQNEQFTVFFERISHTLKKNGLSDIHLIIEPGALISNYAGFLITKVIGKDIISEQTKVIVDSSVNNLSQWSKPLLLMSTSKASALKITTISGTTCYEDDIFVKSQEIKELFLEDQLIFYPLGAYSSSNYSNLHGLPYPEERYVSQN